MAKFSRKPEPPFDPWEELRESRPAPRKSVSAREPSDDPRLARTAIINLAGGLGFRDGDRATLASMAACSLVDETSYYGDHTGRLRQLLVRVSRHDPEWTVKLAVFLREELHLRSASQLVLAHAAMVREARPLVEAAFPRVARRPDDLVEIAALLKDPRAGLAGWLPAVIRRSIARELRGIDEVRVLKYRRARGFGLRHLVRLTHPRPETDRESFLFRYLLDRRAWRGLAADAQAEFPAIAAFERLSRGDVEDPVLLEECAGAGLPWEMVVPRFGSRREVWTALAPRLPIMALLRNLRNLSDSGALAEPAVRDAVRARLTDPVTVRRSRQLPFRWLAAHRVMRWRDGEVAAWLETALGHSVANLPTFPGLTVIACDNSGSMSCGGISERSSVRPIDISSLLGALARQICEESIVFVFGTEIALLKWDGSKGPLAHAAEIANTDVGHATHAYKVPATLLHFRLPVDRILFFTDMQIYGQAAEWDAGQDFTRLLRRYRSEVAPNLRTFVVNLQPYEHLMTPPDEHGVVYCSGWSENLLRIAALDEGDLSSSMVKRVERVRLEVGGASPPEPSDG